MERFVAGDVIVTTFPYSDLSHSKRRPAVVLAVVEFGDLIVCQVTSKDYSSKSSILIRSVDFSTGSLPHTSYARPDKLFILNTSTVIRVAGRLTNNKRDQILNKTAKIFRTH